MEFYELVEVALDEQALQQIDIACLPEYCVSISGVLGEQGDTGRIDCLWGVFTVRRESIRGGVRFTLPGCPNNLAWTVTTDPDEASNRVVVHLTISNQHHDLDFIDSIHTFIADWKKGLEQQAADIHLSIEYEGSFSE